MLSHGRLSILSNVRSEYYSATAAESAAVLSKILIFSFSLLFKSVILNSCFIKTLQRYTLFQYVVLLKPTFFPHFYVVQPNLLIYSMF